MPAGTGHDRDRVPAAAGGRPARGRRVGHPGARARRSAVRERRALRIPARVRRVVRPGEGEDPPGARQPRVQHRRSDGLLRVLGAAAGDPTKGYYSFDVGTTWHIVALNSNCNAVACSAGSQQEQWLRADLAASTRPCTIAFWHHPRFSSGTHGDDAEVTPLWSALADAGAEMVLTGHDHLYERFDPQTAAGVADAQGIREFVVGTGGRSLYAFGTPHANSVAPRLHLRLPEGRPRRFGLLVAVRGRGWRSARHRHRHLSLSERVRPDPGHPSGLARRGRAAHPRGGRSLGAMLPSRLELNRPVGSASVSPRQSPNSSMRPSIDSDGERGSSLIDDPL